MSSRSAHYPRSLRARMKIRGRVAAWGIGTPHYHADHVAKTSVHHVTGVGPLVEARPAPHHPRGLLQLLASSLPALSLTDTLAFRKDNLLLRLRVASHAAGSACGRSNNPRPTY